MRLALHPKSGRQNAQLITLRALIVGGWDTDVIALNEQAAQRLPCEHRITIVPKASHLFEEPGKLDEVSRLASAWFVKCLSAADA
ncbi:MAG: hypothetical protein WA129_03255 [Acidovorax sp.]